jgi:peptidoglycan/LPS O-acetylase OafA/YrhL
MTDTASIQIPAVDKAQLEPILKPRVDDRIQSLDGLRGVASFIVMIWHSFLIASPYIMFAGTAAVLHPENLYWWMTYTPLKVFIAGDEAVMVFFVLSGFAVALPVLKQGRKYSWRYYYPQRLARLYLPASFSVIFAAALVLLVPRTTAWHDASAWLTTTNAKSFTFDSFISQFLLLGNAPFSLNNPLWSLSWEVLFSLMLPLFVFVGIKTTRYWPLAILGLLGLTTWGHWTANGWLAYLPVFAMGTVLAANRAEIMQLFKLKFGHRSQGVLTFFGLTLALLLLISAHMITPIPGILPRVLRDLVPLGALLLVTCAIVLDPVRKFFSNRLALILGKMSFSLYLVHVPILVTYQYLLGPNHWLRAIGLGLITALIVAYLFSRVIELPAHRLSRRLGNAAKNSSLFRHKINSVS